LGSHVWRSHGCPTIGNALRAPILRAEVRIAPGGVESSHVAAATRHSQGRRHRPLRQKVCPAAPIPARTTIDLGARYRTAVGKVPATFRFQIRNIANVYGWRVFGGGGFAPMQRRRALASLTADF